MKATPITLAAALVLAGCSTFTMPPYSMSADTIAALRELAPAKVAVGVSSGPAAERSEIMCRQFGPVTPPGGASFGRYVSEALRTELVMAGAYDANAPTSISVVLEQADFNSAVIDSHWKVEMQLNSTNGQSIRVSELYSFGGSYLGLDACNQVAQAGMVAIQNALRNALRSKDFKLLLATKG